MFKNENSNHTSPDARSDVFDVLVHGLIGVAYWLQLDRAPHPGQVLAIEREWRGLGGAGANCAVALAAWGARVCLTGNPLGDDSNGRLVARELRACPDLTLQTPLLAGFETPYAVILAAEQAPRTLLVRHQAAINHDRQSENYPDASAGDESWPAARVATFDGHLPASAQRLARHLRRRDTPLFALETSLDASVLAESAASMASVVVLVPAIPPDHGAHELTRLARERADAWGNTVVIAWSGQDGVWGGVWCRAGSEARRFAGARPRRRHTPTGVAGAADAAAVFRAGLIWARLHHWDWERGLRFAAMAVALQTVRAGGLADVPRLNEIEDLLDGADGKRE
jgi:sugar/nucleoside kinase (ribokinase family)